MFHIVKVLFLVPEGVFSELKMEVLVGFRGSERVPFFELERVAFLVFQHLYALEQVFINGQHKNFPAVAFHNKRVNVEHHVVE